jgi:hypothetical protein
MRKSLALVIVLAAACGKNPTGGDMTPDGPGSGSNVDPPGAAFEIRSPDLPLPHGTGNEFTKCFYFHTPNTTTVDINKWVSDLTPGSHHMIMFLNPGGSQPADGTIDENCGINISGSTAGNLPVWTFATQTPHLEEDLPADDGTGKPLAQSIPPNTAGYLQMHYLNATDSDLMVHVDLKAYALPASTAFTETEAYVTYTAGFTVPPATQTPMTTVTGSCSVPSGKKFWTMSSHTHKQGVEVKINDGSSMLYDSTDWEHPMVKDWTAPQFYTFSSSNLSWSCSYVNPGTTTIHDGPSAATNEMCMATAYYFPATAPIFHIVYGSGGTCF